MNKQLLPYRILSFILLPIAALMGIVALLMLMVALVNPPALLAVFIFAAVVIYVIASFIFLQKGIENKQPCKHILKDLIKVNAIVSVIFCAYFLIGCPAILSNATMMNDAVKQMMATQPSQVAFSEAVYLKIFKGMLYFFFVFAALLLIHILFTLKLIKQHVNMFLPK